MGPPTIVTVRPCSSPARHPARLPTLPDHPLRALQDAAPPEELEAWADALHKRAVDLDAYVVAGDGRGALVALAFATRRPAGLRALVLSAGLDADPFARPLAEVPLWAVQLLPGPLLGRLALRFHTRAPASPRRQGGPPRRPAVNGREDAPVPAATDGIAAFAADYGHLLSAIEVPTLVVGPSRCRVMGEAARSRTGTAPGTTEGPVGDVADMARFTRPASFADALRDFLDPRLEG